MSSSMHCRSAVTGRSCARVGCLVILAFSSRELRYVVPSSPCWKEGYLHWSKCAHRLLRGAIALSRDPGSRLSSNGGTCSYVEPLGRKKESSVSPARRLWNIVTGQRRFRGTGEDGSHDRKPRATSGFRKVLGTTGGALGADRGSPPTLTPSRRPPSQTHRTELPLRHRRTAATASRRRRPPASTDQSSNRNWRVRPRPAIQPSDRSAKPLD